MLKDIRKLKKYIYTGVYELIFSILFPEGGGGGGVSPCGVENLCLFCPEY